MKFTSDVDIDFADRTHVLKHIRAVPATIINNGVSQAHNTGVYVTSIPQDPVTGRAALDYRVAEQRGYIKLDLLNVHVYGQVRDPAHLDQLIAQQPPWSRLQEREFCEQLIHIGNHYDTLQRMPEPVDTIARLAMFLAVIRPAKRHLIGKTWREVAASVWDRADNDGYAFKKAHGIAYSHLVVVHMNLLNLSNQSN